MRNYLILREKVRAFRADPEVAAALQAADVPGAGRPHAGRGRVMARRQGRRPSTRLGRPGLDYERLDQLALEYLYGVR